MLASRTFPSAVFSPKRQNRYFPPYFQRFQRSVPCVAPDVPVDDFFHTHGIVGGRRPPFPLPPPGLSQWTLRSRPSSSSAPTTVRSGVSHKEQWGFPIFPYSILRMFRFGPSSPSYSPPRFPTFACNHCKLIKYDSSFPDRVLPGLTFVRLNNPPLFYCRRNIFLKLDWSHVSEQSLRRPFREFLSLHMLCPFVVFFFFVSPDCLHLAQCLALKNRTP